MRVTGWRAFIAGATLLSAALVGCGTPSPTPPTAGAVHPAKATATVAATPLPTAQPNAACQFESQGGTPAVVQLSDGMQVSLPAPALQYPSAPLPAALPDSPYQVPANVYGGNYAPSSPVNPVLEDGSGYVIEVCNPTQASHQVTAMSATISSFQPASGGTANIWNQCNPMFDASTQQLYGGGCGGGMLADEYLHAQFASVAPGATARAILSTSANMPSEPLPVTINPNGILVIDLGIGGLSKDGTYQLTFGIAADGAAPATLSANAPPFEILQQARTWKGQNCQSAAAQIPHASQQTLYICPPA